MHRWSLSKPDVTDSLLAGHRARYDAMARVGRLSMTMSGLLGAATLRALVIWWRAQRRALERHAECRRAVAVLRALDDRTLRDMGIARSEIVGVVAGRLHQTPASLAELRELQRPGQAAAAPATQDDDPPGESEEVAHSAGRGGWPRPAPAVAAVVAAPSPLRRYIGRPRYGLL